MPNYPKKSAEVYDLYVKKEELQLNVLDQVSGLKFVKVKGVPKINIFNKNIEIDVISNYQMGDDSDKIMEEIQEYLLDASNEFYSEETE